MNFSRRNILIIGGAIGAVILIIVVLIINSGQKSQTGTGAGASPTPAIDLPAKGPNLPTYYNFNSLLDIGISADQISIEFG